MFKKVKEIAGVFREERTTLLYDQHSKAILQTEGKLKEWESYITNLFEDNRTISPPDITHWEGPLITRAEVIRAIKTKK